MQRGKLWSLSNKLWTRLLTMYFSTKLNPQLSSVSDSYSDSAIPRFLCSSLMLSCCTSCDLKFSYLKWPFHSSVSNLTSPSAVAAKLRGNSLWEDGSLTDDRFFCIVDSEPLDPCERLWLSVFVQDFSGSATLILFIICEASIFTSAVQKYWSFPIYFAIAFSF